MQKSARAHVDGLQLQIQASLRITDRVTGVHIHIDPFKVHEKAPADIILITHPHFDHFDLASIRHVYQSGCAVLVPNGCEDISQVAKKEDVRVVAPGDSLIVKGIPILVVPAYNVMPNRTHYHPKENQWVGFVLQVNNETIYHAGDTDRIAEMKQLNGKVNVSFLPVGGTFTMDAKEASEAVRDIQPDIACPMHVIPAGDLAAQKKAQEEFVRLVKSQGKNAEIVNGKGVFD